MFDRRKLGVASTRRRLKMSGMLYEGTNHKVWNRPFIIDLY
jgi:hypothetical protein